MPRIVLRPVGHEPLEIEDLRHQVWVAAPDMTAADAMWMLRKGAAMVDEAVEGSDVMEKLAGILGRAFCLARDEDGEPRNQAPFDETWDDNDDAQRERITLAVMRHFHVYHIIEAALSFLSLTGPRRSSPRLEQTTTTEPSRAATTKPKRKR